MGMYDNIGEYQVKCFDIPLYYRNGEKSDIFGSSGLSFSGGSLKYFSKGSKVPYKTLWYDYTPNFAIYNYSYLFDEESFIIVRNGKVSKIIKDIEKVKEEDFEGINNIINYYGDFLNISKPEDLKLLKEDFLLYRENYDFTTEESNKCLKKALNYHHISIGRSESKENISKEEAKKLSEEYLKKYETAKDNEAQKVENLRNIYLNPWFRNVSEKEKNFYFFGGLISCYERCKEEFLKGSKNGENNYNYLVIEIKEFLEDEHFFENFLLFQKPNKTTEKTLRKYIKEISKIKYIKEED